MILVSACLLGLECRYDGSSNKDDELLAYLEGKDFIPICPEQMGGLTTPREPAEIRIVNGKRRVIAKDGTDVTLAFEKGASEVLKLKELTGADCAILKARSPSCGSLQVYDGSFRKKLIDGEGLTTDYLRKSGLTVHNELNYKEK